MASSLPLLQHAWHAIPVPRLLQLTLSSSARLRRRAPRPVAAQLVLPPRRSGNYPPSMWDDAYIQSLTSDTTEEDDRRIDKLKEDVRRLINDEEEAVEQLELIDVLQQLGVAYQFEDEIMNVLVNIYNSLEEININMEQDLYAKALLFRLLREHGFTISEDVLNSFKKETRSFKSCLRHETRALLSLYQASYFGIEGETTLDEARNFTATHLKNLISEKRNYLESSLVKQINYALELPLNWRVQRLHTRWFIEMYERDAKMNPIILEFAKLDFNKVQAVHITELRHLSRWWADLGLLVGKLSFCRDRLVENYFGSVGWAFEPKLGRCREALTKFCCFIATIDDIYDVYGFLDELELFTDVVDRWEVNSMEQLPEYMKTCALALFNTANGVAYKVLKEKSVNIIPFIRRAWADLCKSYLVEAKWYHKGYTPTLEEYLENAWISVSGHIMLTAAYCVNDDVTTETLEQFKSYPEIIRWSCMIFRLSDDLGTSTDELDRGDVHKSIQCYINEKAVSETVARNHVRDLIGTCWKRLNKERFSKSRFNKTFSSVAFNIPRTAQYAYEHGDGYGKHDYLEKKDHVISVLMKPISI